MNAHDFVIVSDSTAMVAGIQVNWPLWRLAGQGAVMIDLQRFCDTGIAAGIATDHLPKVPSAVEALSRAVTASITSKVRKESMGHGAWAICEREAEVKAKGDVSHRLTMKVSLDTSDRLVFEAGDSWSTLADKIRIEFLAQRNLNANNVSAWLTKTVDRLEGVTLNPGGGLYFVPNAHAAEWLRCYNVVRALAPCYGRGDTPVTSVAGIVEQAIDAITFEAKKSASDLLDQIAAGNTGRLSLTRRGNECEDLCRKLEKYEILLSANLTTIKSEIETVQAAAFAAALIAQAEKDATSTGA